jgi:catechol 2,3-dioxygenase-like lactoylglutathione lyase family enzyme
MRLPAKIENLVPMLGVDDVAASRKFYCDALGFRCLNEMTWEGRLCWCVLTPDPDWKGGIPARGEIMLTSVEPSCLAGDPRPGRKGLYFYFYPGDVVALHASLRGRGYQVSDLRVTFYRMKEFELEDPNGYQLWFGQETDESPTPCEHES